MSHEAHNKDCHSAMHAMCSTGTVPQNSELGSATPTVRSTGTASQNDKFVTTCPVVIRIAASQYGCKFNMCNVLLQTCNMTGLLLK